jgi:hypothetical protein
MQKTCVTCGKTLDSYADSYAKKYCFDCRHEKYKKKYKTCITCGKTIEAIFTYCPECKEKAKRNRNGKSMGKKYVGLPCHTKTCVMCGKIMENCYPAVKCCQECKSSDKYKKALKKYYLDYNTKYELKHRDRIYKRIAIRNKFVCAVCGKKIVVHMGWAVTECYHNGDYAVKQVPIVPTMKPRIYKKQKVKIFDSKIDIEQKIKSLKAWEPGSHEMDQDAINVQTSIQEEIEDDFFDQEEQLEKELGESPETFLPEPEKGEKKKKKNKKEKEDEEKEDEEKEDEEDEENEDEEEEDINDGN